MILTFIHDVSYLCSYTEQNVSPDQLLSLVCRRSSWSERPTSPRPFTASLAVTTSCRLSPALPLTRGWWEWTHSAVSSLSTSPRPRRPTRVRARHHKLFLGGSGLFQSHKPVEPVEPVLTWFSFSASDQIIEKRCVKIPWKQMHLKWVQ